MTIARGQPMLADDILDLTFFPVGSILMMDGGWTDGRGGWYICDGRNTPYGKTPDLKDKFVRGGSSAGGTGGSNSGSASITLTAGNLPKHNHSLSGTLTTGNENQGHAHAVTADGSISGGMHGHTITDPGHKHTVTAQAGSDGGVGYLVGGNYGTPDDGTVNTGDKTTGISIASTTGAHDHTFTGKQVTSGDSNKSHTHSVTLNGNTGDFGNSSTVSIPVSIDTVPVYYTMIYIKKMA